MDLQPECFSCLLKQAAQAAALVTSEATRQMRIVHAALAALAAAEVRQPAPLVGALVHEKIKQTSGVADPYEAVKAESNRLAARLLTALQRKTGKETALYTAVKAAIAGNIIDYGNARDLDLENDAAKALEMKLFRDDFVVFEEQAKRAESILYLLDNAGEIVFDRLLVEELEKIRPGRVAAVVKSAPIINDATMEDARAVGLDRLCRVIPSGLAIPGTVVSKASPEFQQLFRQADMVISKGQGNFETLHHEERSVFFLLQTKCRTVARLFQAPPGSSLLAFKPAGANFP